LKLLFNGDLDKTIEKIGKEFVEKEQAK
jgi:hypothetical protein